MVYSLDQLLKFTLPALLELKRSGKVRYISASFYHLSVGKKFIRLAPKGSIDTVLSYGRCYIVDQGENWLYNQLTPYCSAVIRSLL